MGATSRQVVVITGASSGIGRETARQFAAQGAAVVLAARGEPALRATAEEVTRAGGTALVVPTDVAVWPQVQYLAHTARERFGRIDVWVDNAAVSGYGELREQGYGTIIGVRSGLGCAPSRSWSRTASPSPGQRPLRRTSA